ncbi:MAG: UPF0175 family protein [Ruminococcus sp.]|nr:UPF0175 family protein [Ruminococcus sp.]
MMSINVNIPDAVLFDTKMSPELAESYARQAVALRYYTQKGVSLGYCAEIAGMSKSDFIKYLGDNSVSIFSYDDEAEFLEEMNNA